MTAEHLREVLEAIERGDVTITPAGSTADEIYAGNVTYSASNGWTIVVFNDCNCWDYLESATAPGGERVEYPNGFETEAERGDLYELFVSYEPPGDVIRETYGFTA